MKWNSANDKLPYPLYGLMWEVPGHSALGWFQFQSYLVMNYQVDPQTNHKTFCPHSNLYLLACTNVLSVFYSLKSRHLCVSSVRRILSSQFLAWIAHLGHIHFLGRISCSGSFATFSWPFQAKWHMSHSGAPLTVTFFFFSPLILHHPHPNIYSKTDDYILAEVFLFFDFPTSVALLGWPKQVYKWLGTNKMIIARSWIWGTCTV